MRTKNKYYWQCNKEGSNKHCGPAAPALESSIPWQSLPAGTWEASAQAGPVLPPCSIFNKLSVPLCEVLKSWRGGEVRADGRDALSACSDQ